MVQIPIDTQTKSSSPPRARPSRPADSAASVTIIDNERIERLGEPLVPALLRLVPSAAVAIVGTGGFAGRGAHPRRRGQSHPAVHRRHPRQRPRRRQRSRASSCSTPTSPRGSRSSAARNRRCGDRKRSAASSPSTAIPAKRRSLLGRDRGRLVRLPPRHRFGVGTHRARRSWRLAAGWQRASGIDIFGGGDRDGYRNLSGRAARQLEHLPDHRDRRLRLRLDRAQRIRRQRSRSPSPRPTTGQHATGSSPGRSGAGRQPELAVERPSVGASVLGSTKRQFLRRRADQPDPRRPHDVRRPARAPLCNRRRRSPADRRGRPRNRALQGPRHRLRRLHRPGPDPAAPVADRRMARQGGAGRRRRRGPPRPLQPLQGRDQPARFGPRQPRPAASRSPASYGEGIAQPTFFDLYGFFPGSFVGNPSLKPESSRGFEASLRYRSGHAHAASLTVYRQRLSDEIVDVFDSPTFPRAPSTATTKAAARASRPNSAGSSATRSGCRRITPISTPPSRVRSSARRFASCGAPSTAARSRSTAAAGRLSYGASIAYTGTHDDMNFDVFPFRNRAPPLLLARRCARSLMRSAAGSSCSPAPPTPLTRATRTCSAIAPKGGAFMPASALLIGASVASLNLCTDEYLLLLARPPEIASVSFLSQDPLKSPLWRSARRYPANRGSIEDVLDRRPDIVLTMGGGGRATRLIARQAAHPPGRTASRRPRSMTSPRICAPSRRRWAILGARHRGWRN